jgi:hypothetical protein
VSDPSARTPPKNQRPAHRLIRASPEEEEHLPLRSTVTVRVPVAGLGEDKERWLEQR